MNKKKITFIFVILILALILFSFLGVQARILNIVKPATTLVQ